MQEGPNLEFKEDYSKSFLKTVSAFSNYGDGEILFGVNDEGDIVGVKDPKGLCLRIENAINDSLEPLPRYSLNSESVDNAEIVRLKVLKGVDTPYYALGKAYKRNHTSTVKVDSIELKRLVLQGLNMSFEEGIATTQALEFTLLDSALEEKLGLDEVDEKVYKTLELCSADGVFNNAAAVLADENRFPGIDIVRFGKSIDEFMERHTYECVSALELYGLALDMFNRYYKYEVVTGFTREHESLVPEEAYREVIANALVHRDWSVNAMIKISLFEDGIEVVSPGGLPPDVSESDYLAGRLSILRNPIIANVFARLGYIEKFGTGIPRIKAAYEGSGLAPRFAITSKSITVTLPVKTLVDGLDKSEQGVLDLLDYEGPLKRIELENRLGINKTRMTRLIKALEDKGLIDVEGVGRATRYRLKH